MQAVFSAIFYFAPIALYQGWLMVGYAMIYASVFLLLLDRDVNEDLALLYPKLYKKLTKVLLFLFYFIFCLWLIVRSLLGSSIIIQDFFSMLNDWSIPRSECQQDHANMIFYLSTACPIHLFIYQQVTKPRNTLLP